MTEAEKLKDVTGARLSCQILVDDDMVVRPLRLVRDESWDDPGKRPKNHITPDAVWIDI